MGVGNWELGSRAKVGTVGLNLVKLEDRVTVSVRLVYSGYHKEGVHS
jgi:hypothetical protein